MAGPDTTLESARRSNGPVTGALSEYRPHRSDHILHIAVGEPGRQRQADGLAADAHGLRIVVRLPTERRR